MYVQINEKDQLFILSYEGSYSCLGFKVVFNRMVEMAKRLKKPELAPALTDMGTLKQYTEYQDLLALFSKSPATALTWFDTAHTSPKLRLALENARMHNTKVRVFNGDPETGRDWLSEFDTIGTIGRSSGAMKVPLLMTQGYFGEALLVESILKLVDIRTGDVLYQHPKYQLPVFELNKLEGTDGYGYAIKINGQTHAREKTLGEAAHYIAFMEGRVHVPVHGHENEMELAA